MRSTYLHTALVLSLCPLAAHAVLPAGHLDPGFATDGKRTIAALLPGGSDRGPAKVLDGPGGTLYVVGNAELADATVAIAIARLTADGVIDDTFGSNGVLTLQPDNVPQALAYGAAFDAQGRLIVVGEGLHGGAHLLACRLDAQGTIDATFGTEGSEGCIVVPAGTSSHANDVLLQACSAPDACPDGQRIIIAGSHIDAEGIQRAQVVAILPDGSALDETFGTAGIAALTELDFGVATEFSAIEQDSSGTLLAAGHVGVEPFNVDMLALKLSATGERVTTFGDNGFVFGIYDLHPTHTADVARTAHLADDGSILLAGSAQTGALTHEMALLSTDISGLGVTRLHYRPCESVCDVRARDMHVLPDGTMLLAGNIASGTNEDLELDSNNDMFVMRIRADGTPDAAFRGAGSTHDGLSTIDFAGTPEQSEDVGTSLIVRDDRIIVAGYAYAEDADSLDDINDNHDFAVARLGFGRSIFADGFE